MSIECGAAGCVTNRARLARVAKVRRILADRQQAMVVELTPSQPWPPAITEIQRAIDLLDEALDVHDEDRW